ncbi:MAG TPA: AccI family restriction endonuclease, partial [Prosthecobacter sp.]|nr:AccI family restriction endonuclease [Prosthecobacter sp.]
MSDYLQRLTATLPEVIATLQRKGIDARHLDFGGEGKPPAKKITVPTDARSEFLANRAMGDWAEQALAAALRAAFPAWKVVQYGNTDRIAAGHPEFKDRYLAGVEETRRFGKRPDLLLLPADSQAPADISEDSHEDSLQLVQQSLACIEVRSSKFEAL